MNDMEIVLASRNRHKIAEIERVLKESGVNDVTLLSLDDIGFDGDKVGMLMVKTAEDYLKEYEGFAGGEKA